MTWIESYDPASDRSFWYNRESGESTWQAPAEFITAEQDQEAAAAVAIQSAFRASAARAEVARLRSDPQAQQGAQSQQSLAAAREAAFVALQQLLAELPPDIAAWQTQQYGRLCVACDEAQRVGLEAGVLELERALTLRGSFEDYVEGDVSAARRAAKQEWRVRQRALHEAALAEHEERLRFVRSRFGPAVLAAPDVADRLQAAEAALAGARESIAALPRRDRYLNEKLLRASERGVSVLVDAVDRLEVAADQQSKGKQDGDAAEPPPGRKLSKQTQKNDNVEQLSLHDMLIEDLQNKAEAHAAKRAAAQQAQAHAESELHSYRAELAAVQKHLRDSVTGGRSTPAEVQALQEQLPTMLAQIKAKEQHLAALAEEVRAEAEAEALLRRSLQTEAQSSRGASAPADPALDGGLGGDGGGGAVSEAEALRLARNNARRVVRQFQGDAWAALEARDQPVLRAFFLVSGPARLHALHCKSEADGGRTMLHWVCARGDAELLALLLEYAPPVDATDTAYARMTPLMEAARAGSAECCVALVAAGADVLAADAQGATYAHWAARARRGTLLLKTLRVIEEQDPALALDVLDARDQRGRRAVDVAANETVRAILAAARGRVAYGIEARERAVADKQQRAGVRRRSRLAAKLPRYVTQTPAWL